MNLAMQKTLFFQLNLKKWVESTQKWHLKNDFAATPKANICFVEVSIGMGSIPGC